VSLTLCTYGNKYPFIFYFYLSNVIDTEIQQSADSLIAIYSSCSQHKYEY
jgi:hypothetical protein